MRKLLFILIINLAHLTGFQYFSELPKDMQNEILFIKLEENIKNLILEYNSSKKSNKLKIFFKKFSDLFVNKQAANLLRQYIPARKNGDWGCFYVEDLLTIAAEKNWDNLFKIILENTDFGKMHSDILSNLISNTAFFLCANKNSKMIDILQNYLPSYNYLSFFVHSNNYNLANLTISDAALRNAINNKNFIYVKFLLSKVCRSIHKILLMVKHS